MGSLTRVLGLVLLIFIGAINASNGRFSRSRRLEGYVNVVITLKEDTSLHDFIDRLSFFGATLTATFRRTHAVAVTLPEEMVDLLEIDSQVQSVEDDSPFMSFSETIPWGISAVQGHDASIPAPVNTGNCFSICIVDTGLQVSHPDIPFTLGEANIQGVEFNLRPQERWFRPGSAASHGTHVTGTIIAEMNNNFGTAGIVEDSSDYCLLIARVFPDYGDVTDESVINAALEWCADSGAKVINMSLGGPKSNENSRRLFEAVVNEGVLVVAASGNRAADSYMFPASYETVMSVSAVDRDLTRPFFSVFNDQVDICAPGVDVLSTTTRTVVFNDQGQEHEAEMLHFSYIPDQDNMAAELAICPLDECGGNASGKICLMERGQNSFYDKAVECQNSGGVALIIYNNDDGPFKGTVGESNSLSIPVMSISREDGLRLFSSSSISIAFQVGGYMSYSGTSMASPHVTAVAAKIWAARPGCTNFQIRQALEMTAMDLGSPGKDMFYGHGLVQAAAAYQYLLTMDAPCGLAGDTMIGGGAPEQPNFILDQNYDSPPKKIVEAIVLEGDSKMVQEDPTRGGLTRRRMVKGSTREASEAAIA